MRRRSLGSLAILVALTLLMGSIGIAGAAPPDTGRFSRGGEAVTATGTDVATVRKENRVAPAARSITQAGVASVIVKLDTASLAAYTGEVAGLPATSPLATGQKLEPRSLESQRYLGHVAAKQRDFEARAAGSIPGSRVTHRFDHVFGGVAMTVPLDQVDEVAKLPGAMAVYHDQVVQLDTDRSPGFIGAPELWGDLGGQDDAGEGVIVGVLDTGIWPEHPSFSDPDPTGERYAAPPPTRSGTRQCEFSGGGNPGPAFSCNNKLIGADRVMATYDLVIGLKPGEFTSARDDNGHGSHTAGTAAGNRGVAASLFGIDRGTISGIAPRAHVMAYKVCGDLGCFQSDSVAAVQKAIQDNVNVINFSISGGANPFADPVELAFLDAYNAGVFVAASAGNAGPTAETVDHRGPWTTTVGASRTARHFLSTVTLIAPNGARLNLVGSSVTPGIRTPTEVVIAGSAPYNDPLCLNSTPDGAFAGKIVVCQRGPGRVLKSYAVSRRGAVGMLLYNTTPLDILTDNFFVPGVHLQNDQGRLLLDFLGKHAGTKATFTPGAARVFEGDVMATFSSRGGPGQSLGISKPDLTAPGIQILAANTPAGATPTSGPAGQLFQSIQGTSMSSPHVAGAAALLKDLHPTWTPGQIKSALMTTATTRLFKEDGERRFTPFDAGSGRVNLKAAGTPGITFEATGAEFLTYRDQLYRANYPSLYLPSMPGEVTVQRTARSVLSKQSTWWLNVSTEARDITNTVPQSLVIPAGGAATFDITVDARNVPLGQVRFATLTLKSGPHEARLPITLVRGQAPVLLTKSCTPAVFPVGSTTDCTITMRNPTFTDANVTLTDTLPGILRLVPGSVTGGAVPSGNGITFTGTLPATVPPGVTIAPGGSPAGGYLPLRAFGVAPLSGVGDDVIINFNVAPYRYAGETYTSIGFSSNGYAVVGGGSGPDNTINNQNLPNPTRPNNVLAPFWTDLDPSVAGALRINYLTDGTSTWLVLDWEGVREFSADRRSSFQIWIGLSTNPVPEDISFAYGPVGGNGDGGFLTVGAENRFGNRGGTIYFNGTGTLPTNGTQLRIGTTPPGAVTTQSVGFRAEGRAVGRWTNYAEMTSNVFYGTSVATASGQVTVRP